MESGVPADVGPVRAVLTDESNYWEMIWKDLRSSSDPALESEPLPSHTFEDDLCFFFLLPLPSNNRFEAWRRLMSTSWMLEEGKTSGCCQSTSPISRCVSDCVLCWVMNSCLHFRPRHKQNLVSDNNRNRLMLMSYLCRPLNWSKWIKKSATQNDLGVFFSLNKSLCT